MKKIVCILLFGMVIFVACGCVSRSEYKALESRVEVLEQRNGISSATKSSDSASVIENADFSAVELSNYISNYDEVVAIIQEQFNNNINSILDKGVPVAEYFASFKQFGNGQYYIYVNDVCVFVTCEDFTATYVNIEMTGGKWNSFRTPSADRAL